MLPRGSAWVVSSSSLLPSASCQSGAEYPLIRLVQISRAISSLSGAANFDREHPEKVFIGISSNPNTLNNSLVLSNIFLHEMLHSHSQVAGPPRGVTSSTPTDADLLVADIFSTATNSGDSATLAILAKVPGNVLLDAAEHFLIETMTRYRYPLNFTDADGTSGVVNERDSLVSALLDLTSRSTNPITQTEALVLTSKFVAPSSSLAKQCFPAGTPILLANGSELKIEEVGLLSTIMAHDEHGNLVPGRVTQLLDNITTEWLLLSTGTTVTPGHRYLQTDGTFEEIGKMLEAGCGECEVVLADGSLQKVTGERIVYSEATAHL